MRTCASIPTGANYPRSSYMRAGFTLLELCIVMLIMAILLGASLPAMQSAIVENGVRNDSRQLSLMVKTAMLLSTDQHRVYVIELTPSTMSLHPAGEGNGEGASSATTDNSSETVPAVAGTNITTSLDSSNKLLVPDPEKTRAWVPILDTSWIFQPGELCPARRVRLSRGKSWLEMSFNPLTGNVEDESTYFP